MVTAIIFKFATIWTVVRAAYSSVEYAGSNITVVCNLSSVTFPRWTGPSNDGTHIIIYNYYGHPKFNSVGLGDKVLRVNWAQNERDLIIRNLRITDGGNYSCRDSQGNLFKKLYVRVRPNKPQILGAENQLWREIIRGTEDQDVSLTCISSGGYPAPYLDWYWSDIIPENKMFSSQIETQGNDSTVTVTVTSNFNAKRRHDMKSYICQSSYDPPPSPQASSVVLYLSLKPTHPVINGDITVTETSSSTLKCESGQARPVGNITWTLQGHPSGAEFLSLYDNASETYTMTSSYTTRTLYRQDNGGIVACIVGHEAISTPLVTKTTLDILFAPDAVDVSGNRIVVANGSNNLTLKCRISSANPVSNISWTGPGMPLTIISSVSVNGLYHGKIREEEVTFTPNRDMDGKAISCMAKHYLLQSEMPLTKQVTLDLKYGPITAVLDDSPKIVVEGQSNISVTCFANSKPRSLFKWHKTGISEPLVSGTGTSSSNTLSYTIATVNRTHAGHYSCTAENGIINTDNSAGKIQLIVQFPPDVTVTTMNATIKDEYVDIYCTAAGVPSNYTFTMWQQTWPGNIAAVRDQLVSTNQSLPSGRTLRLTSLSFQDTGVYTCGASNGVYSRIMTGSSFLLVKSDPVLANRSKALKKTARLNTPFMVTMAVYSNDGNITAKMVSNVTAGEVNASVLIVDERAIILQVYGRDIITGGYSLTLTHIIKRKEEFGNYTIAIKNDFGTIDVPLEVIAEVDDFLSKPNIGLVAGGVVGGLIPIATVIVIVKVLLLFRRPKKSQVCQAASEKASEDSRSAASEYDLLDSETTNQHIYTGLEVEATTKPNMEERTKQRTGDNTRRMRPKDVIDNTSEQNLGQKVVEPDAVYSNLMIGNA